MLLPLLHQKTILLDLDQYAIKSYNALQAGIVINAVDSERTGQVSSRYLFSDVRVITDHCVGLSVPSQCRLSAMIYRLQILT